MAGVGLNITEIADIVNVNVIPNAFGTETLAGAIMILITAIWIFKYGLNGIGVLVTGWVALILYFTGAFGYKEIISGWIGALIMILILIAFIYSAVSVFKK